jgi:CPA2 family monovalent cation:H+ antiporter-2
MGIAADLILVVLAGLAGGLVARRLNQPLILGYILAGIVVGPYTGGITVADVDRIENLAEIGVALLLFSLGLEFSLKQIAPIRRVALGGTALQALLTLGFGFAIGHFMEWDAIPSLWFAVAIVSSSTAVILKTLASRGRLGTLSSRVMLGMSIVQDIAVIPLMVLLMGLDSAEFSSSAMLLPVLKVVLFVAAMLYVGAKFIPLLLKFVARWESRELFLLAVTGIGLGVGYLTYSLDLSFAFGAFMAGLVLSESDYGRRALSDLIPVRDVFGLLFFVAIGMLLDPAFLIDHLGLTLGLVVVTAVGRGAILSLTVRLFGYRNIVPAAVFFGMIPISEIAFILLQAGLDSGAVPRDVYAFSLNTVILSMLLGPPATALTAPFYAIFKKRRRSDAVQTVNIPRKGLSEHVIIAGGGLFARYIGLALHSMKLPYVIIEPNHALFLEGKKEGLHLLLGEPGQDVVLEAARVEEAKLLVLTLQGSLEILDVARTVRKRNGTLRILAQCPQGDEGDLSEEDSMISRIIHPEFEAGLEMARQALIHLDVPVVTVHRELEALRRNVYGQLREESKDYGLLSQLLRAASSLDLQWEALRKGDSLSGKSIAGVNIRARFGVSVVAVLRGGELIPNPGADFLLEEGDLIGIIGTPEQNHRFFCFLDTVHCTTRQGQETEGFPGSEESERCLPDASERTMENHLSEEENKA